MQLEREIKGVKIGFRFGGSAAREFLLATQKFPGQFMIDQSITADGVAKLMHAAYQNFCAIKDIPYSLDLEFFANYVEEVAQNKTEEEEKFLEQFIKMWQESSSMKDLVENSEKKKTEEVST